MTLQKRRRNRPHDPAKFSGHAPRAGGPIMLQRGGPMTLQKSPPGGPMRLQTGIPQGASRVVVSERELQLLLEGIDREVLRAARRTVTKRTAHPTIPASASRGAVG